MTDTFEGYAEPEWNEDGAVALALQRLRDAHDASSANEAYDQFLWTVGDNEAGTYYPVVLATLPALRALLDAGSQWPQQAVLESLIDLCGSFVPEEGHEVHDGVEVKTTLQAAVHAMSPLVARLASAAGNERAAELLELIDDQRSISS